MPSERLLPPLFSNRVASFEVRHGAALTPLFDAEESVVARAVDKRRWEFRAGRHCARRALGELGLAATAVPSGPDRAPVWPSDIVGSITHTGAGERAYAAAVVARVDEVRALGVDAELSEPLADDLLPRVLLPAEQAFVDSLEEPRRGLVAMLHFSAKEAFYKCQYPLTGRFLGFQDVEVTFELERNQFLARLHDAPKHDDFRLSGRFSLADDLIVTAVELGV